MRMHTRAREREREREREKRWRAETDVLSRMDASLSPSSADVASSSTRICGCMSSAAVATTRLANPG
jgi:hypothetical protein